MGQQQLILLVLATVIVGIAIVVGIAAFTENSAKANADAMMQDAVRVANDMQAWKKKPAPFGGQAATTTGAAVVGTPANFADANWARLGYGGGATYTNLNGQFQLTVGTASTTIEGRNVLEQNTIQVVVNGVTDQNIAGTITCLGGELTTDAGGTCAVTAFPAPDPG